MYIYMFTEITANASPCFLAWLFIVCVHILPFLLKQINDRMIDWTEMNWTELTAVCENLQCVREFGIHMFRSKRPSFAAVSVANQYEVRRDVYVLDCAHDQ